MAQLKLVDPIPVILKTSMEPLRALIERLAVLSNGQLKAIANGLITDQSIEYPALGQAISRSLATAEDTAELADLLVLNALRIGDLTAYALQHGTKYCYRFERAFWNSYLNTPSGLDTIQTGELRLPKSSRTSRSMLVSLNRQPLVIDKKDARRLLRPTSKADLKRIGMRIASDWKQSNPSRPMRRADFEHSLVEQAYGCSREQALSVWRTVAESAWKRPGRRPGR